MKKYYINKYHVTKDAMIEAISIIAEHPESFKIAFENSEHRFRLVVNQPKNPVFKTSTVKTESVKTESEVEEEAKHKLELPELGGSLWKLTLTRIVKPETIKGFTIYLDRTITTKALMSLQDMLKKHPVKIAVEYTANDVGYAKTLYDNLHIPFPEQYTGFIEKPANLGPETSEDALKEAYMKLQKLEQDKFEKLKNEFYKKYTEVERTIIEWANFRNADIYPINANLPDEMEAEKTSIGRYPQELTAEQARLVRYLQREGPAYGVQVPYLYVMNETSQKTSYLPLKTGNKPVIKYVNARYVLTHRTQLRTNSTYMGIKQERKRKLLLESFGVDQDLLQERVETLNYLRRSRYEMPYYHKCKICGRMFPERELVRYNQKWACIECLMSIGEDPKKFQNVDFFDGLDLGVAEDELYYILAEAKEHPDFKTLCQYYDVDEEGLEAHLLNTLHYDETYDDEEKIDYFENNEGCFEEEDEDSDVEEDEE